MDKEVQPQTPEAKYEPTEAQLRKRALADAAMQRGHLVDGETPATIGAEAHAYVKHLNKNIVRTVDLHI